MAQRIVVLAVVAAWSLLLLCWLTLHWGILPHIDEWRPLIERRASQAIGLTVRIGRIEVQSFGWVPVLQLREVELIDRAGRPAVRLPRVTAALAPRSLLAWRPRFAQLYVEGAELEVRRDSAGRLHIGGLDLSRTDDTAATGDDESTRLDWLLEQPELVIRHGLLRWVDEQQGAPPLLLRDVDLVVRNGLLNHEGRLDATPPAAWGERFSVRARFSQPLWARTGDWRRWRGKVYATLPGADVAEVRRQVRLPFNLQQGVGALRGWIDVDDGQWRAATLDLALREVSLRLAPKLEPLAFEQLQVRLNAARQKDRVHLDAQGLDFTTDEGWRWPAGRLAFDARQTQDLAAGLASTAPITGGSFSADRLDLALMAHIASRLPLPQTLRRQLDEMAPEGVVHDLQLSWDGPPDALDHYRARARLTGLGIAALPSAQPNGVGRPGWRHADLQFDATEAGGRARLTMADGALDLPGVFEAPLVPLDKLSAQLAWQVHVDPTGRTPPRIVLDVADAHFANADLQGRLQARWNTGPGSGVAKGGRFPGELDLSGRIEQGRAESVARYLPLGIPEPVRRYVGRAVRGGQVSALDFKARGDLWALPSPDPREGEFRIAGHVDNADFAYVPPPEGAATDAAAPAGWPPFTALSGELVFDHASMEIRRAQARLWGYELKNVNGRIDHLAEHPVLNIEGAGRGPLADALHFVNSTPIGGWTGQALGDATVSGNADLQVALAVPLDHADQTRVKGSLLLAGNDVRLRKDTPLLAGTRGRLDFAHDGFSVVGASARVLGGELTFAGGSQADGSLRFAGQGSATADALRRSTEWPALAHTAAVLTGQAAYQLQLGFVRGQTELALTSNLAGMGVLLPAPLHKPAEASLPLRIETRLVPDAEGAPRDRLQVDIGNLLHADYPRQLGPGDPRVLGGSVSVRDGGGKPSADPVAAARADDALPAASAKAAGDGRVRADIALAQLDTDAWRRAVDRLLAGPLAPMSDPSARAGPTATGPGDPAAAAPASASAALTGYLPSEVHLQTPALTLTGRKLTQVDATVLHRGPGEGAADAAGAAANAGLAAGAGSAAGELWRVQLASDQAKGVIEYRPGAPTAEAGTSPGRVYARLSRLALPPTEADSVETLLDQAANPGSGPTRSVPALDIVADDFQLGGKDFGRLEVQALNRPSSEGRGADWLLTRLSMTVPEARLTGTGRWSGGTRRQMALDFKLDLADSGAFVERLGMGPALKGGKGHLQGNVSWTGSPLALDYPSLAGRWQLALDSGRFMKADAGAARLLGVLSLQSLPRRFALDFRDVFQEGFAFDNVSGDIQVAQGIARTNNLRMRGVQAAVLMEGNADLQRETQDLRVVVVPEINAGTASLAYAAINPAIGLGTFLAQMFLRRPLMQAGTREFHVAGPWADPKVESVPHKAGPQDDPASSAAEAAALTSIPASADAPAESLPEGEPPAAAASTPLPLP